MRRSSASAAWRSFTGRGIPFSARCGTQGAQKEFAEDPDIRKRFSIESRAVAKLSHHNIVSVFDVGSEDGTDYIVMELIEGITLKQYLQRKGHLSWEETIFFAEQVARALMHAHPRGIIHQDVKPQNVIILRDGTAKADRFRHCLVRCRAGDPRGAGGHRLGALYFSRAGQGQQDRTTAPTCTRSA